MNSINFFVIFVVLSCSDVFLSAFNANFDNEVKFFDHDRNYEKIINRVKRKCDNNEDQCQCCNLKCNVYKRGGLIVLTNCYCDDYEEFVQKPYDHQSNTYYAEKCNQDPYSHDKHLNNYYHQNKPANNNNHDKTNKHETQHDNYYPYSEKPNNHQMEQMDNNYSQQYKRSVSQMQQQPFDYYNKFRRF